ncbi:phage tail sheath family protein [Actinomadura sp. HBU206391]|uniref:phage tail sheath family protein n=1 Tax=Actinomadura sp. HBU206391 TaxID=2731692 RepID=UPI00164F871C|nr:phage tail sheath C-terminal domain-containing protein [Actinomadura sp. HBU206391]MBC6463035.1 phage tail sheath family protein [Actinomadura sp. HBU206391]
MPVTPTYPGVYIEELPSTVRTITAVTTSVTAFVGYVRRGPLDRPVTVTSFADFERRFGGLSADSPLSHSVQQFFLQGGSIAIIVRLAKGAEHANVEIQPDGGNQSAIKINSLEAGAWGDGLRVAVDPGTAEGTFDLRVFDPAGSLRETHTGLTTEPGAARNAATVVNSSSTLIEITDVRDDAAPVYSGSGGVVPDELPDVAGKTMKVSSGDEESAHEFILYGNDEEPPGTLAALAVLIERKIRAAAPGDSALSAARVRVIGQRLQIIAGDPDATLALSGDAVSDLNLAQSAQPASVKLSGGVDGSAPEAATFIEDADGKKGIYALTDVEDVNLLCLPDLAQRTHDGARAGVLTAAARLCADKRMFLIVDAPESWSTLDDARAGLPTLDSVPGDHAALYFPHLQLSDPLTGRLMNLPPSGTIAGIMARTDASRGVWKAPAGTEATLGGVVGLTVPMTDAENGLLNPLGANCLRSFPVVGPVVWGARTLDGADRLASQWKYVPVRRLALMIEESLYRGTKWVVFEPNDERLWSQIRLNVGAFMNTLFRQGAFQGSAARDAYLVKCDKDTTTQDDINRGVVNIVVGFAPLKPAEFVIVKIEQMAGQIEF